MAAIVEKLLEQGVVIPVPGAVEIDPLIDVKNIAPGVQIHVGSRLLGPKTAIGPGCTIGSEGPAVVENCQLASGVKLGSGYFSGAVFLAKSGVGGSAHVRPGTLLEEEASAAHAVGLKQTVFFPYVTAGSLINFCDALVAGGTSRSNHTEIGSSYIHFNFTAHGDKATPSLVGDVPHGVLLNNPPIFLGGQGGLVGPRRLEYGTVLPAGLICRQDVFEPNKMLLPKSGTGGLRDYEAGIYRGISSIWESNLAYLGNIWALRHWYELVRRGFLAKDHYGSLCYQGALAVFEVITSERLARLDQLVTKLGLSVKLLAAKHSASEELVKQRAVIEFWPRRRDELQSLLALPPSENENLRRYLAELRGDDYLAEIKALAPQAREFASSWLQSLVDAVVKVGCRSWD